jgi:hypothetical protein
MEEKYLPLLQAAAVTVVACVLIVGALSDLFALDPTGEPELGGRGRVMAQRFQGRLAGACQRFVLAVGIFLTAAYSMLCLAIIISLTIVRGAFTPTMLMYWCVLVVAMTIFLVCWIAALATWMRWRHMQRLGLPPGAAVPGGT